MRTRAQNRKHEDSASVSVCCFIIACISAFMCVVWREMQVVTWQISPETFHASREGGGISQEDTMAWLRLVGSLKLQVSFTEYHLFHKALLQTRPTILRSLVNEATPYRCTQHKHTHTHAHTHTHTHTHLHTHAHTHHAHPHAHALSHISHPF